MATNVVYIYIYISHEHTEVNINKRVFASVYKTVCLQQRLPQNVYTAIVHVATR